MLTKTRTTIATLIAASSFAFAVGPLAPVASAAKNTGRYQQREAPKLWQGTCQDAEIAFENALTLAEGDIKNQKYFDQDMALAKGIQANAKAAGCTF